MLIPMGFRIFARVALFELTNSDGSLETTPKNTYPNI